jgi:adenylate kinase family enzyme|tara:strand:+ start:280 stop:591 length:312 start_codon:yes stop_codon:yes gene_type:complete
MTTEMTHEENFITAIIAQAIDDCIYDGTVEYKLQHKMDASNWIFGRHPEFMNYCKMLALNPEEMRTKIMKNVRMSFTPEQRAVIRQSKDFYSKKTKKRKRATA